MRQYLSALPLTVWAGSSILGTLGGVLFLAIIDNGLNPMGLNYLVKDALVGVILVVAPRPILLAGAPAPNASLNGRTMATLTPYLSA